VDDLSRLQVFEGASTRTSVFVLRKGEATRYPVPYTYWQKTSRGQGLDYDSTLEEVSAQTCRLQLQAAPVDKNDPTSAWLTARPRALAAIQKVLGRSAYRAYEGVNSGGANAVYWLEILTKRPDGMLVIRNVTEGAKREVDSTTACLEPDLVYPLLRNRDVQCWKAQPSLYILMMQDPQTRRGLDATLVQQRYPKTWAYLKRFEKELRERSGFQRYFTRKQGSQVIETAPFYSMFNVGEYTFAPWKVVWGRMGNRIEAAVVSNAIPQETISFVACNSEDEAHYIAALINSVAFQCAAYSYSQAGGKSFGSPHILENICVRQFSSLDKNHQELSELSRRAHAIRASNDDEEALRAVEAAIDRAAARAWGLTDDELAELRASLKELKE
jgi:hypothetical protein